MKGTARLMVRLLTAAVAFGLLGPSVAAQVGEEQVAATQAVKRRATLVTVLDEHGAPVEAASVVCFGSPWYYDARGDDDLIATRTDAKGRAVVQLLTDREYSIAATKSVERGFAATSVERDVLIAGGAHEVRLGPDEIVEPRFLAGLPRWAANGPLSVEVSPLPEGSFFVPIKAHPHLPFVRMRVLDGHGDPLWQGSADDGLAHGIPEPHPVKVLVEDAAGKPIAGAAIWHNVWGSQPERSRSEGLPTNRYRRRVGTTDRDGEVTVRVPVRVVEGRVTAPLLLQAEMHGMVSAQAGLDRRGHPYSGRKAMRVPKDHKLRFRLHAASRLRIRPDQRCDVLVVGKETPTAPRALDAKVRLQVEPGEAIPVPITTHPHCVRVAQITPAKGHPVWTLLPQVDDVCEVALQPSEVAITLRDRRGNPVRRGGVLSMVPLRRHGDLVRMSVPLRLDSSGRCRVHLNADSAWMLVARSGEDIAWRAIQEESSDPIAVDLQLQPMPRVVVAIRDANGKPVVDRRFEVHGTPRWSEPADLAEEFLVTWQRDLLIEMRRARTPDANGEVWLPSLPLPSARMAVEVKCVATGQKDYHLLDPGTRAETKLKW